MSMPWDAIGRFVVLTLAWMAALAVLAIVELYWPGVYKFLVHGLVGLGLWWLIFGGPR